MADTGYTVQIVVDGTAYDFDLTPQFDFDLENFWKDSNEMDRTEIAIPMIGRFRGDPALLTGEAIAGNTWDQFFEVWELIQHATPVTVRFYLNGTIKKEFAPAAFAKGPWIGSYKSADKESNQVGNTVYELVIRMTTAPEGTDAATYNVVRSSRTETVNKRLQLREWILQFRGTDAEKKAKAALPTSLIDKGLRITDVRRIDDGLWERTITWERWQTSSIILWSETCKIMEGGASPVFVDITGGKPPLRYRSKLQPYGLVVSGHMEAITEDALLVLPPVPPGLEDHYDAEKSELGRPSMPNPRDGIWHRDYTRFFSYETHPDFFADPRAVEAFVAADEALKVEDSEVPGLTG